MLVGCLAFFLFYYISFKAMIFHKDKIIEESLIPSDGPFSIKTMPFSVERIVYYVSIPSPSLGLLPDLYEKLTVDYVEREIFDNKPLAIQVYYQDGTQRKIVAELLGERFEVPYLDSLYGEKRLTKEDYENLKDYKYTHISTQKMFKDEVHSKLRFLTTPIPWKLKI